MPCRGGLGRAPSTPALLHHSPGPAPGTGGAAPPPERGRLGPRRSQANSAGGRARGSRRPSQGHQVEPQTEQTRSFSGSEGLFGKVAERRSRNCPGLRMMGPGAQVQRGAGRLVWILTSPRSPALADGRFGSGADPVSSLHGPAPLKSGKSPCLPAFYGVLGSSTPLAAQTDETAGL